VGGGVSECVEEGRKHLAEPIGAGLDLEDAPEQREERRGHQLPDRALAERRRQPHLRAHPRQ
jgi:hypothetical protein